jgi:hypothetical protein
MKIRLEQGRPVASSSSSSTAPERSAAPAEVPREHNDVPEPLTRAQAELMARVSPAPDVMQMVDYVTLANRVYQHYPLADKQLLRAAVVEYCRFLTLKVAAFDRAAKILSPSVIIDQIWHLHVLDTKRYEAECKMICGSMLHRKPDGDADNVQKQIRRQNTRLLYDIFFPARPHAVYPVRHPRSHVGSLVWSHDGGGLNDVRKEDITAHAAAAAAAASAATTAAAPLPSRSQPNASAVPVVQSKKRKPYDEITFHVRAQSYNMLCFERISSETTVSCVKQWIRERTGIPVDQQRLIWQKTILADEKPLAAYEMLSPALITLVRNPRGC